MFDVAIVGGGPVGAVLAHVLAREGFAVAVLEREAAPETAPIGSTGFDGRAIALAEGGRRLLAGWGLWEALMDEAEPIERIHVSLRKSWGSARFVAQEEGVAALGQVLDSARMAPVLLAAAKASGVHWQAPARYIAHEVQGDGVVLRFSMPEGEQSLHARLLVAADGAGSIVRSALGLPVEARDYGQTAILARVEVERVEPRTAFERFTDEGPIALLPMGDNRYALVWVSETGGVERRLGLSDAAFLDELGQRFGPRLGRFIRLGPRQAYPLRALTAKTITAPRTVVVGNAAHALHPVAGQGLNLGLRDIRVLLGELSRARQEGRDIGADAVLAAYAAARQADYAVSYPLMDVRARGFTRAVPVPAAFKGLALVALEAIPPLRAGFLRQMMGLKG
ncbi:MAG: FAD-dependent monooxygenase [Gammaproteobacteria bacterium]|nr:FAD-dependent monooxygenase [Gammaproteobacteria bacterium]